MTRKKIVRISPHLDDAVFSAGGLAAAFVEQGHAVTILTCFTKSILDPKGFALACQLDKGLSPEVDYMQLRREEDRKACEVLGAHFVWLDLPEAPHRGYQSAKELFREIKECDKIQEVLFLKLKEYLFEMRPDMIFSPIGIGNHVDHQQVCLAVQKLKKDFPGTDYFQWYDQPYLLRNPLAIAKRPIELIFENLSNFESVLNKQPNQIFSVKTEAQ